MGNTNPPSDTQWRERCQRQGFVHVKSKSGENATEDDLRQLRQYGPLMEQVNHAPRSSTSSRGRKK